VFSFATHWTDDKNYRVHLTEHLQRIHAMLAPGGLLVFESHTTDVGDATFYSTLEGLRDRFTWTGSKLVGNGSRELFIMRKTPELIHE